MCYHYLSGIATFYTMDLQDPNRVYSKKISALRKIYMKYLEFSGGFSATMGSVAAALYNIYFIFYKPPPP